MRRGGRWWSVEGGGPMVEGLAACRAHFSAFCNGQKFVLPSDDDDDDSR